MRSPIKTLGNIATGTTPTLVFLGIVGLLLVQRTNLPASPTVEDKRITSGAFSFMLIPPVPQLLRLRHLLLQALNPVIQFSSAHSPAEEI